MGKQERNEKIDFYKNELSGTLALFITSYSGLKVKVQEQLRKKLKEVDGHFLVIKNTLLTKAINDTSFANIEEDLTGPIGIAYTNSNPGGLAKILVDFSKKNANFLIKSISMDGKRFVDEEIERISQLPSFEQVRAMFLGILNGVATKFVTLLTQAQRDFLGVINAKKSEMEEE